MCACYAALFLTRLLTQFFYSNSRQQNSKLNRTHTTRTEIKMPDKVGLSLEHTLGSARRQLHWRWSELLLALRRSAFPFSSLDWQLQGSCMDRWYDDLAGRFCSGTGDKSDEGVPRQHLGHVDSFDRGYNVTGFLTFPYSKRHWEYNIPLKKGEKRSLSAKLPNKRLVSQILRLIK